MKAWLRALICLPLALLALASLPAGDGDFLSVAGVAPDGAVLKTLLKRHLAAEAEYKGRADAMQAFIAEHKKMLKDYQHERQSLPDSFGVSTKEMGEHCKALIRDAEALQEECRAFAQWHAHRAALIRQRLSAQAGTLN